MLLLPTTLTALVMGKQSNVTVTDTAVCNLTTEVVKIIYLFNYYMKLDQLLGLCSAE
jgi:hypothetical protein